jgi:outer membrane protein assembly factor BamB
MRTAVLAFSLVLVAAGQPATAATQPHLRPLWTVSAGPQERQITGAAISGRTLVRASTLYRGYEHPTGELRRYDAGTGADLGGIASAPGWMFGTVAGVDGRILVQAREPSGGAQLRSYTWKGKLQWQQAAPGEAFAAGNVLVASGGDQVRAIEVASGKVRWSVTAEGDSGTSAPVLAGDRVLRAGATADGFVLSALDERTGAVRWRAGGSGTRVVVAGDTAVTVGAGGTCAFALATGERRWCAFQPAREAIAAGGTLFVVEDGYLTALGRTDGSLQWRRSYQRRDAQTSTSYWTPAARGGVLYAVVYHYAPSAANPARRHRHELLAVSAAHGHVLRRIDVPMPYEVGGEPLLLTRSAVYFATLAGLFAWSR